MIVMGDVDTGANGRAAFTPKKPFPSVKFPMVRNGRDRRLLTVGTFPPLTTIQPRDAYAYQQRSYLRMNQWDGSYQSDTTMGARWSNAYLQFAAAPGEAEGVAAGGAKKNGIKLPKATAPMDIPGRGKYARRIAKIQYPLRNKLSFAPYPLAGMHGMGDSIVDVARSGVQAVTGQAQEISDKLDQVKALLLVSTGASVVAAIMALRG